MKVRGDVFSGVLRGTPLIEKYYPRLIGLLGFRPYRGTMDVKLERSVDIRPFAIKTIEHILQDGRKKVDAFLAPVKIRKMSVVYKIMELRDREKELVEDLKKLEKIAEEKFAIKKSQNEINEPSHDCWAAQFKNGIYQNDVVELVSKDMIKEKLSIEDGDKIEIEFSEPGARQGKAKNNRLSAISIVSNKIKEKRKEGAL